MSEAGGQEAGRTLRCHHSARPCLSAWLALGSEFPSQGPEPQLYNPTTGSTHPSGAGLPLEQGSKPQLGGKAHPRSQGRGVSVPPPPQASYKLVKGPHFQYFLKEMPSDGVSFHAVKAWLHAWLTLLAVKDEKWFPFL